MEDRQSTMARILVVEDSPDQAYLVENLLQRQGLEVETVTNGAEALTAIARHAPDLVVTDLQMPTMNGLELVQAAAAAYPCLPIVLITAYGSEEIAVQALQQGAASYIPKRRLRDELVDTVQNLLAPDQAKRERACVLKSMTQSRFEFQLRNDIGLIPPLVAYMEEILAARLGHQEDGLVFHAGVALSEAIMNAIHHGNLEVDSELRETDPSKYQRLVRERLGTLPYRERFVFVHAEISTQEVLYRIRDQGPGFAHAQLPDPLDTANLLKLSGRGLFLIRTFMDSVVHNEAGNEITMVKRFHTATAPTHRGDQQP